MQDLEKQLQHQMLGKIIPNVTKGSDYIKTTIVLGGLSSDQVDSCMKSVMQKWVEYQTVEIKKTTQATQKKTRYLLKKLPQPKSILIHFRPSTIHKSKVNPPACSFKLNPKNSK
jgi:hypothetical protein